MYKVHKISVTTKTMKYDIERYLNGNSYIKGEVISVIPQTKPIFLFIGIHSRIDSVLIIEKINE